jgi:hypothetical protein
LRMTVFSIKTIRPTIVAPMTVWAIAQYN